FIEEVVPGQVEVAVLAVRGEVASLGCAVIVVDLATPQRLDAPAARLRKQLPGRADSSEFEVPGRLAPRGSRRRAEERSLGRQASQDRGSELAHDVERADVRARG